MTHYVQYIPWNMHTRFVCLVHRVVPGRPINVINSSIFFMVVFQSTRQSHDCSIVCDVTLMRSLEWRHNGLDSVSNHQPHACLLNRLFRRKSKKTSKLRVTGLCVGNSPGTGEFPAQMASNAENVSIWWRHHVEWIDQPFIILATSCGSHTVIAG